MRPPFPDTCLGWNLTILFRRSWDLDPGPPSRGAALVSAAPPAEGALCPLPCSASFRMPGSSVRVGDMGPATARSCPGLTTLIPPAQVSQGQRRGCVHGLTLPASLVTFTKNPRFLFFILFLVLPARKLKREEKALGRPSLALVAPDFDNQPFEACGFASSEGSGLPQPPSHLRQFGY